ncbi:hypothetical protein D3C71_23270 [compost metagenome]
MVIRTDDDPGTVTLSLSGQGQAGTLTAADYIFPDPRQVGDAPVFHDLVVKNASESPVRVGNVSIAAGQDDFQQNNNCVAGLVPPGASCSVRVGFSPSAEGTRAGQLVLESDSDSSPNVIVLTGEGKRAEGALAITSFGQVQVGAAFTNTATLTNTGVGPLQVSRPALTGNGFSMPAGTTSCSDTLLAGASCSIPVAFAPAEPGESAGNLSVSSSAGPIEARLSGVGVAPAAALSSLDFGDVLVSASKDGAVTLSNQGIDSITVGSPKLAAGPFSVKNNSCPGTLQAGAECSIALTANPSATGVASSTLEVSTTAGLKTATLAVRGTAGALTLSPATLPAFPVTQVGQTRTSAAITVTNSGTATLTGLAFNPTSDFSTVDSTCGVDLAAGQSCAFMVRYSPSAPTPSTGAITLSADAPAKPVSMALSGTGAAQAATLSDVAFGSVLVGSGKEAPATLKNTGVGPLTVGVPTSQSIEGAGFTFVSTTCTAVLDAGASCLVAVRFAPAAGTAYAGTLKVSTGAGERSATLSAVGLQPIAQIAPATVTFAPQQVAAASTSQSVSIRNTGSAPLHVTAVKVASGAPDFSQSSNCATVAVNDTCVVTVSFAPTSVGPRSGALTVEHDGIGDTSVALAGTGQAASADLTPVSFGNVSVSKSSTAAATLTNTGLAAISVTPPAAGSVSGTDFKFASSTCGTSLAAGASCQVLVSFTPTAASARTGQVSITTGAGTKASSLEGTGIQGVSSLSTASLTFAATQVGTAAASRQVTLTNTGSDVLNISAVQVSSGASDFGATSNCTAVNKGDTCTVTVTFTPTAVGARAGTVTLAHDGTGASSISVAGNGQAQAGSLSTPTFSATAVGSSSTATATLSNEGIGVLSVTKPTASAVTGSGFSFVSTTCGASLAVSATCSVTVRFSPTSTSPASGALTVATGAGPKSVTLGSTGIQGYASVSPAALTFSAQQTGTSSAAQAVTVTNTGTNVLQLSGVGISSGTSDFAQSNNCASVPINGTCTINVSFTPSVTGARAGTLSLVHDGGGVASVNLSGTGQDATATLSAVSFPNTVVSASTTLTSTLQNTGIGPISVTTPSAASVTGTDFSFVSTTCGSTLAAGATCNVSVKFSPSAKSARTGTLTVATGAGTKTAALSGTGLQGTVSVAPSSLVFDAQQTGTKSSNKTVTVTNTGTAPLTVTSVRFELGTSVYAQSNTCSTALAVNGTCTISVSFTPPSAGSHLETISVVTNGSNNGSISVTGTGQAPSATLTAPTFSATQVGESSVATATLTNTGLAAISVVPPVAASVTGTDFAFSSTTCGSSLAAGASCATSVRFSPTATTARTGSLSISTGAGVRTASLSATGAAASVQKVSTDNFSYAVPQNTSSGYFVAIKNNGVGNVTVNSMSFSATSEGFSASMNASGTGNPNGGNCWPGVVLQPGWSCGAWARGDGAIGATPAGTVTFSTSAGAVTYTGGFTVHGLTYSAATGAATAPTSGQTASLYTMTIRNDTPFTYYFPVYGASGGATNVGRFTGGDASNFIVTATTCGASLAPSANCKVTIAATGVVTTGLVYASNFQPNGTFQQTAAGANATWSASQWLVNMGSSIADVFVSPTNPVDVSVRSSLLKVQPGRHDFAKVQVGEQGTKKLTLSNSGNLAANPLTFDLPDAYTLTDSTCGTSLAAQGSCTFWVVFTPTAAVRYDGIVNISGGGSSDSLQLTGTGVVVSASLTGSSFGTVTVGGSKDSTVTLTNTGSGSASVGTATITAGVDMSIAATTCSTSLAAGASCTWTVRFAPQAAVSRSATFSVSTGAGTKTLALTGTGAVPSVVFRPQSTNWGTIGVSSDSGDWPTIVNNSNVPVLITAHTTVSGPYGMWSWQDGCVPGVTVLQPGGSCQTFFGVGTGGVASGGYYAVDRISYRAVGSTTTYSVDQGYSFSFGSTYANVGALGFGEVNYTTSSAVQYVYFTNYAYNGGSLKIAQIVLTGGYANNFQIVYNSCGSAIAPGGQCAIGVRFSPITTGPLSTTLQLVGGYSRVTAGVDSGWVPANGVVINTSLSGYGTWSGSGACQGGDCGA